MLQQPEPDDYVVATGETHSVREFCKLAFAEADLDYRQYVVVDENFYRPSEVDLLVGTPPKRERCLDGSLVLSSVTWCVRWCRRT